MGWVLKLATMDEDEINALKEKMQDDEGSDKKDDKRKGLAMFTEGFLYEAKAGTFDFDKLLNCIDNDDEAVKTFYTGMKTIEKAHESRDPKEAYEGVLAILKYVEMLEKDLPKCDPEDAKSADWKEVDHIDEYLYNPDKYEKVIKADIETYGKKIEYEVKELVESYKAEKYKEVGMRFADVLELITMEPKPETDDYLFLY